MRSIKQYFDGLAMKFGNSGFSAVLIPGAPRLRTITEDMFHRRALKPLFQCLNHQTILEVGSGVGRWSIPLSENNNVIGIDISREMTKVAKARSRSISDCEFLVASADALPFRDQTFDLVFTVTVLQHIVNNGAHTKAISEMLRATRSRFLILEEMWSQQEIIMERDGYLNHVLPATEYTHKLTDFGGMIIDIKGINFMPLVLLSTRFTYLLGKVSQRSPSSTEHKIMPKAFSDPSHWLRLIITLASLPGYFMLPASQPTLSIHTLVLGEKRPRSLKTRNVEWYYGK